MDEQRMQAYRSLVEQLMWCEPGDEPSVLQQNAQWVDTGLLERIVSEIDSLKHRGKAKVAQRLQTIQQGVVEWIADHPNQIQIGPSETSDKASLVGSSEQFLLKVFQLIRDTPGNPQQVYAFLQQHQGNLNEELLHVLPQVVSVLLVSNPGQQQFIAAAMGEFGNLLQQFPLGVRWLNLEIAIAAYEQALQVMTRQAMPVGWATSMTNLASAYRNRIRGERAQNIEDAIAAYKQALQVRTRKAMPVDWAQSMNNLALAYYSRIRGNSPEERLRQRAQNIEEAIAGFKP